MNTKETVNHIKNYIESCGYAFIGSPSANLFLSLKTKPLVMIKSQDDTSSGLFVRLFFESIGITEENGYFKTICPGGILNKTQYALCYINSNGNFCPGEMLNFIMKAANDSKNIYALYIDGINFVNPDEFLREIINSLDKANKSDFFTYGNLFSENYFKTDKESENYGCISFPHNLYIIASVCNEDNFYPVSQRIRSRISIIDIDCDTSKLLPRSENTAISDCADNFLEYTNREYLSAEIIKYFENYIDILQRINIPLKYIGSGFGTNVIYEILYYLALNQKYELLSDDEAFDNCLNQRILSKIHGTNSELKNVLGIIFKECVTKGVGDYCSDSLKMYRALTYPDCRFKKSAEKIAIITRYIEENGYYTF